MAAAAEQKAPKGKADPRVTPGPKPGAKLDAEPVQASAAPREDAPLGAAEITRLLKASQKPEYAASTHMRPKPKGAFRKHSLSDIARPLPVAEAVIDLDDVGDDLSEPSPPTHTLRDDIEDAQIIADDETIAPPANDSWAEFLPASDSAVAAATQSAAIPADIASASSPATPAAASDLAPGHSDADLAKARAAGYEQGYGAGVAASNDDLGQKLARAAASFESLMEGLTREGALDTAKLRDSLRHAILGLAALRAGGAIADLPQIFIDRIETLLERAQHMSGRAIVTLNPDDLSAISSHIAARPGLSERIFAADPAFRHGDIRIRVGGAEIADLIAPLPDAAADTAADPAANAPQSVLSAKELEQGDG